MTCECRECGTRWRVFASEEYDDPSFSECPECGAGNPRIRRRCWFCGDLFSQEGGKRVNDRPLCMGCVFLGVEPSPFFPGRRAEA